MEHITETADKIVAQGILEGIKLFAEEVLKLNEIENWNIIITDHDKRPLSKIYFADKLADITISTSLIPFYEEKEAKLIKGKIIGYKALSDYFGMKCENNNCIHRDVRCKGEIDFLASLYKLTNSIPISC